jgi:hypothetical protein
MGTGEPPVPYIRIEISAAPGEVIRDLTLPLVGLRRDSLNGKRIARAEYIASDQRRSWLTGSVTIDQIAPGESVSGRYDFESPLGRLKGSFDAKLLSNSAQCG